MPITQDHSPIHRIFEEAFNQGKLAVMDEVFAPDHFVHSAFSGTQKGSQDFKGLITTYRTGFPDLQCTIEDEINEGDMIAAHWTMRGTHKGLFLGNLPTNRTIRIQGTIFAKIANQSIAEYWILLDQFGLLQQLGLIPG